MKCHWDHLLISTNHMPHTNECIIDIIYTSHYYYIHVLRNMWDEYTTCTVTIKDAWTKRYLLSIACLVWAIKFRTCTWKYDVNAIICNAYSKNKNHIIWRQMKHFRNRHTKIHTHQLYSTIRSGLYCFHMFSNMFVQYKEPPNLCIVSNSLFTIDTVYMRLLTQCMISSSILYTCPTIPCMIAMRMLYAGHTDMHHMYDNMYILYYSIPWRGCFGWKLDPIVQRIYRYLVEWYITRTGNVHRICMNSSYNDELL